MSGCSNTSVSCCSCDCKRWTRRSRPPPKCPMNRKSTGFFSCPSPALARGLSFPASSPCPSTCLYHGPFRSNTCLYLYWSTEKKMRLRPYRLVRGEGDNSPNLSVCCGLTAVTESPGLRVDKHRFASTSQAIPSNGVSRESCYLGLKLCTPTGHLRKKTTHTSLSKISPRKRST